MIQPQKLGPYKIIDTPTLVTYELEDSMVSQSPVIEVI